MDNLQARLLDAIKADWEWHDDNRDTVDKRIIVLRDRAHKILSDLMLHENKYQALKNLAKKMGGY